MDDMRCFCYTFSEDTVNKILYEDAYLSTGGAKRADGTMLELGKPVILSRSDMDSMKSNQDNNLLPELQETKRQLEISLKNIDEVKKVSWLTNIFTGQLAGITFEGFKLTLEKLDKIIGQLNQESTSELIEKLNRYKHNLKNYAGYLQNADMEIFELRTSVISGLDEVSAFIERINKDFLNQNIDGKLAICMISGLVGPFAYIVKRCSALYYYEQNSLPPAFDDWLGTLKEIAENKKFSQRLMHTIRVESDCCMEDKFSAYDKFMHGVSDCISNIEFEKKIFHNVQKKNICLWNRGYLIKSRQKILLRMAD